MKKNVLLSSFVVAMAVATLSQAHEFKNEKLKNFYGNARANFGYTLGMNETNISSPKYKSQLQYIDLKDNSHDYDHFKSTHHQLSIGVGYNFYYKGFSKFVHPFIGVKGQFGIPLSARISSRIGYFPKEIFDDDRKTYSSNNMEKVDQGWSLYNFLEIGGRVGTKFNINNKIAVETFIGYGKTMSHIKSSELSIDYEAEMYINSKGERVNKIQSISNHASTFMPSVYSAGVDVIFKDAIFKETFTAGLEYKFIDFQEWQFDGGATLPKHYLSFNLGYQFF